jgi:hypothetical protein
LIKENNTVNENVNTINVPLSSVYNIANKTVSKYLENERKSNIPSIFNGINVKKPSSNIKRKR